MGLESVDLNILARSDKNCYKKKGLDCKVVCMYVSSEVVWTFIQHVLIYLG